jgi:putative SOS response-associated peptidase YedK
MTLNATCERLLDSKMYKEAAIKRRCLILSSGFYEWQHFKPFGVKKPLAYPYHITVQTESNKPLFFMAGIFQPTIDFETGELKDSFAIVTTAANSLMEQIHNLKKRMPTILPLYLAEEWLSNGLSEQRILEIASFKLPSEAIIAHTIRKDFRTSNNPLEAFEYSELPTLVREG